MTGRPRRISDGAIVDAGIAVGLDALTMRGVAEVLGATEMTLYRRTGGIDGLRKLVAEGLAARIRQPVPAGPDAEEELLILARALRDAVVAQPGLGPHLVALDAERDRELIAAIDTTQRRYADHFGWPPGPTSVLLSVVSEHAVALAHLRPAAHRAPRPAAALADEQSTVRAGAETIGELSPDETFDLSMRATIRGALELLGLPRVRG